MTGQPESAAGEIRSYLLGYGLALALTAPPFAIVAWHPFETSVTLGIVFALAVVQMLVHFRCFLHISLRSSARDALQLILFSALTIALMAGGKLVILINLRHRIM